MSDDKPIPYVVTFKGPGIMSAVKIESPEDMEIVDLLVDRVRKSVTIPKQEAPQEDAAPTQEKGNE